MNEKLREPLPGPCGILRGTIVETAQVPLQSMVQYFLNLRVFQTHVQLVTLELE